MIIKKYVKRRYLFNLPNGKMAKVAVDVHSSGNLLEVVFSMDGVDHDKAPHILQSVT